MNRQIQDKKVEIIGKKNLLLKETNLNKKQILINQINKLEQELSSLESQLAIQRAPSIPKTPTTRTSSLESRLANARETSYQNKLVIDRLTAGLEELRSSIHQPAPVVKSSFIDRLTQRLTPNNNKKEITIDDLEDLLADVELPKGGKRKRKKSNKKRNTRRMNKKRNTRRVNNKRK